MEGYNSKQRLYVFIAIGIFITINIIAVVLALPYLNKGSVKGIFTDSLTETVLVEGNIQKPVNLETNKEIFNSTSLFVKNINYTFGALPQSSFNIQEFNKIQLITGIYYFDTVSELTLINKFNITVAQGSRIVVDTQEGNIYVLKGNISILNNVVPAGFAIRVNSENISKVALDKTLLLSTNKIKEFNTLLASKSLFIPELNFVATPSLEFENNLLEVSSINPIYVLNGTVSELSKLYINGEEVLVNEDGAFTQNVNLVPGINNIEVTVVDEVANTLTKTVKIIYTN